MLLLWCVSGPYHQRWSRGQFCTRVRSIQDHPSAPRPSPKPHSQAAPRGHAGSPGVGQDGPSRPVAVSVFTAALLSAAPALEPSHPNPSQLHLPEVQAMADTQGSPSPSPQDQAASTHQLSAGSSLSPPHCSTSTPSLQPWLCCTVGQHWIS